MPSLFSQFFLTAIEVKAYLNAYVSQKSIDEIINAIFDIYSGKRDPMSPNRWSTISLILSQ